MKYKYLKLMLFAFISCDINSKNIIWDLGGVLLKPNKFKVACDIGLANFAFHAISDRKIPNIEFRVFEFLSLFNREASDASIYPLKANGERLPDVMVDWMTGTLTGLQIISILNESIEELYSRKYFSSYSEKKLIQETIKAIFDPSLLGKNIKYIKKGLSLVEECSKKNNLYILSNWDMLSFDKVYSSNFRLFQYFNKDNIYISGRCGFIKPYKDFYEFLLKSHNLNPRDCIFIDDQKENIDAAEKLGITGIWLKNNDYVQLRKELVKLGAI